MKKLLLIVLLIVGCEETVAPLTIHGCLDSKACNYDADATIDNNSCAYVSDCAGVCGGSAVVDECDVCNGDNSTCSRCFTITLTTSTQLINTMEYKCYNNISQEECEAYLLLEECSTNYEHDCHCDVTICNSTSISYEQGLCENYDFED